MSIQDAIENYIVAELLHGRRTHIDRNESLIHAGILDSLTLLQLIAFIEERFGVVVDEADMNPENFQTINAATAFVERKAGGSEARKTD